MSSSSVFVFGDVHDFQAALSTEARADLVLTRGGPFYARLERVGLPQIAIWRVEETLPRIAFIHNQEDKVLIFLPDPGGSRVVWAGLELGTNHMISVGPRECLHAHTSGPCRWNAIWFPAAALARYGRSVLGTDTPIPNGICRWEVPPTLIRELRLLTRSATNSITRHPQPLTGNEAMHGLEQQIIHELMGCIVSAARDTGSSSWRRSHQTMVRLERYLADALRRDLAVKDLCSVLGISDRRLRSDCATHLGVSFVPYTKLKRLQAVRQTLAAGLESDATVADVAHQFGFHHPGRFAGFYRKLYGELPSVTASRRVSGAEPKLRMPWRTSVRDRPARIDS